MDADKKKCTILIVDDDPDIVEIIRLYLSNAGYAVRVATTGHDAMKQVNKRRFDLILLDIMLPDCSGIELCRSIRQSHSCPVLFISCIDDPDQVLTALTIGGDSYIRKPFYPKELVAQVTAMIRRVELERHLAKLQPAIIKVRDLIIDKASGIIYKGDQEILLSPIELKILLYMLEHPNRTVSCNELYERIWQNDSLGDIRTVMVHISNLRKKLERDGSIQYIKTEKKRGYTFKNQ